MKKVTRTALLLLSMALSYTLPAQPADPDLFRITAPIRKITEAGAAVVMNQFSDATPLPPNTEELIQQMAEQLQSRPALTDKQQRTLQACLRNLQAQYRIAIELDQMELAKAIFREDFDFDRFLALLTKTIEQHAQGRPFNKAAIQENYLPCTQDGMTQTMSLPLFLDNHAEVPVRIAAGTNPTALPDIGGRQLESKTLFQFPATDHQVDYRLMINWTNLFGQSESRILEVVRSGDNAPEAIVKAMLQNRSDLKLPFNGMILLYSADYRFEQGFAYHSGQLQSGTGLTINRAPLMDQDAYPIGACGARQELLVYQNTEQPAPIPLNDICYQKIWSFKIPVKGSYLDIKPYLD